MSTKNRSGATLRLSLLGERLAVCRLDSRAALPEWTSDGSFFSITRTTEELSIICPEDIVPEDAASEKGWRALKVEGPLDFAEVGVLVSVAEPMAVAGVSILAISTYDTDYVLVREDVLETALAVLRKSGHEVLDVPPSIAVRPSRPGDEEFLWEMLYEAVYWGPEESGAKPPPEKLLAEPELRHYLTSWGRVGDLAIIAQDNKDARKVGAAWYRLFPASDPGYGFVDAATPDIVIAVSPGWRGVGVGGTLLGALVEAARSNGFKALSLSVQKDNRAAVALYEKNGFFRLRDDEDAWVMKVDLTADTATSVAQ